MSSTSYIDPVLERHGLQAAFDEACNTVRRQADEVDPWWNSRLFGRHVLVGGGKNLLPATEVQISRAYDLQACEPEVPQALFCDKDDELYSLTIAPPQRRIDTEEESPLRVRSFGHRSQRRGGRPRHVHGSLTCGRERGQAALAHAAG